MKKVQSCFVPLKHRNALRDPQNLPDAKAQVQRNVSGVLFMETAPGPPEHKK
jgi:hypothetical protein